jgi:L-tyrosine isonitrile synthase
MSSAAYCVAARPGIDSLSFQCEPQSQQRGLQATTTRSESLLGAAAVADAPKRVADRRFKVKIAAKPDTAAIAKAVLRSFNTWSFKREQPSDPALLLRVVAEAVAAHEAVPFVLYWGKGPRHQARAPEIECLDYLGALTARIKAAYAPGAALRLILTDTHAALNGHAAENMARYFGEVEVLAGERGMTACRLSELVAAAGQDVVNEAAADCASPETLASLAVSAAKWYRGAASPEQAALDYYRMNMVERRVVERSFPRSVFITFNGGKLRSLFPENLPIFYMYSLRRGLAVKPWFLPAEFDSNAELIDPSHHDAA